MKVSGSRSPIPLGPTRGQAREAGADFAPSASGAPQASAAAARVGALGAVGSLDALLALQETLSPLERRRRAVRRAGVMLDALDDLKFALIDPEGVDASAAGRLADAIRQTRDETDDSELEALLEQVEIRAAVEIAKRETTAARAKISATD